MNLFLMGLMISIPFMVFWIALTLGIKLWRMINGA